ncbi:MAG: hypothetical protein GYA21_06415 [Myxococcales bacterium]|nr:hypothetical protein [Myxococcales bacterium]
MPKMRIITLSRLNRAVSRVQDELIRHGFWDDTLSDVDVYLVPLGTALGWQLNDGSGEIRIPLASLSRLGEVFRGCYTPLADVLRHEYGHAIADTHRGLFRARRFSSAFGATYQNDTEWEFDPECHVSEYAAKSACEDFAEVFMLFLRHRGRLPQKFDTPTIRDKWKFVRELGAVLREGRARW